MFWHCALFCQLYLTASVSLLVFVFLFSVYYVNIICMYIIIDYQLRWTFYLAAFLFHLFTVTHRVRLHLAISLLHLLCNQKLHRRLVQPIGLVDRLSVFKKSPSGDFFWLLLLSNKISDLFNQACTSLWERFVLTVTYLLTYLLTSVSGECSSEIARLFGLPLRPKPWFCQTVHDYVQHFADVHLPRRRYFTRKWLRLWVRLTSVVYDD